jgi:hypothetical protein
MAPPCPRWAKLQHLTGRYWQDLPDSERAEQFGVAEAASGSDISRLGFRLRNILVEE